MITGEGITHDEQVSAVEIAAKDGTPIVQVERNDFHALASPTPPIDGETSERPQSAILSILKFSFDPKYKSDFYYQGNKISAYIRDKAFYENVDNGDSFSKGDALEVVMDVKRAYDPSVDHKVIKGYEIKEVKRHIPRGEKGQIDMEM
ncbi:hypothetical protein [Dyadobacter sp. BHUBP1]|uniref:hypothetical protein n=1 Tax=Dyadobacter sp. BHUBP1 TaxID=3424178 RepID=UPI003D34956B